MHIDKQITYNILTWITLFLLHFITRYRSW